MSTQGLLARRNGVVVVLAALVLVISGGIALARDGDQARLQKAGSRQQLATNTTGGVCKSGFDTQTASVYPPDDNVENNPPAGRVRLTKSCSGAVAVTFSSETWTPTAGDYIDLTFYATCTGTGGYRTHCAVGTVREGAPGHINFATCCHAHPESHAYTQVFSGLRRGKWRFDVRPGSDGPAGDGSQTASVRWRTTMVQAYSGG
jgi:hypothetical protein